MDLWKKSGSSGPTPIQAAPPREPLVRRTRRREIDILDSRLVQHRAKCADGFMEEIGLLGSHADPEQLDLFVEGHSVLEDAVESRRRIEGVAAQAVHGAAESDRKSVV